MLRTKLGLTQVQLANLIGVSRHTIVQVENREKNCKLQMAFGSENHPMLED
ncbi:helix-turn-helix transcriptional regulator [Clostridium sp.]|uniref:helix-turn-helix transcriptional regulator n=1 Tax=Clostridium sp. TaxID=1506 RepID=UPI0035A1008E